MPRFTIRKGDRDYEADRLEALVELVSQGLLGPGDQVSVDGGAFRPAGQVADLDGLFDDSEPDTANDALLTGFLDQISNASIPSVPTGGGPADSHPTASELLADFEADDLGSSIVDVDPPALADDSFEPMDDLEGDFEAVGDLAAAVDRASGRVQALQEPSPTTSGGFVRATADESGPASSKPRLAFQEPPDEGLPPSFQQWLHEAEPEQRSLLRNFGKEDGGVRAVGGFNSRSFNPVRALAVVAVAAMVIFGRWLYVDTIAGVEYPLESELISESPYAGANAVDAPPVASAKGPERLSVRKLKSELRVPPQAFDSVEGLQDSLLVLLSNFGAEPLEVEAKANATRMKGGQAVPTRAEVVITLRGVPTSEEDPAAQVQGVLERYARALVGLGEFTDKRQVIFDKARVVLLPPSPFDREFTAIQIDNFWHDRLSAADAVLGE